MRRIKWGPQKCLRTFGERTSKEAEGVFPGRGKQTGADFARTLRRRRDTARQSGGKLPCFAALFLKR